MILLLDNYDSFVFNLARYFERLGQATRVVRSDALTADDVATLAPRAVVISPGPCTPREAGCSLEVVRHLHQRLPILGICLGHQAIGEALGGKVIRAREPVHGRSSPVFHEGHSVFAGLPSPLAACRYHSLIVDPASVPASLEVTAQTADGTIMGLAHRKFPVVGLQFHPESILTDFGYSLLATFLRIAGLEISRSIPELSSERVEELPAVPTLPATPVTF